MKVIHTLGWYFPEASGGTEVYVNGLVQELNTYKIQSIVAAPSSGHRESFYSHDGVQVYRYPNFPHPTKDQIRGHLPHGGFDYFTQWLANQNADIYHQHSFVTGCSIHHLRQARKLGLATVVTIHVPGSVCLRGTMLLNGQSVCDGRVERVRCGTCWGIARGIPASTAAILSRTPLPLSTIAESSFSGVRLATAVATPALVTLHQNSLLEMAAVADRVIAVCQWLYDALVINGVPESKLVLCRQGVTSTGSRLPLKAQEKAEDCATLRLGFLGRWDRVKGLHILVEAVRNLPQDVSVELIIYALAQGEDGQAYQQEVLAIAAHDPRIHFKPPVGRDAVFSALADVDMLAVPSLWLETGPLVVLEAQAVGTPVLGSNLGGIAELVHHGVNGALVPAGDVSAWSQTIALFATRRDLLAKLRKGIKPVRTMSSVASEMANLYQEILKSR
ncbi:glycosyltransferase [Mastigocladopsis repens]|uniref:glycosyltransferase n=1 Tax=Mastigocladopsis repens TaxID=221287 RepID=UPI00030214E9|nr:glycosyltransferase [Mastigocladopsis repens]